MANQYIYDLSDTWNAGGTTFAGIKMNVTDSASASDSKLLQLQIGGADKFAVGKGGDVTLTSDDAGATAGPVLTLYRNSGTPAASDIVGKFLFQGEDDAGNTEDYAEIYTSIGDATSTSEDGSLLFRAKVAGTMTTLGTLDVSGLTLGTNVAIVFAGTGAATTRTNMGLGDAATQTIGTSGATVPLLNTSNTWSNTQTISAALPIFKMIETDGTSTHNQTFILLNLDNLDYQTRDSGGVLVSTDYRLSKGASGATSHSWRINNVEKLLLNSSGLTVTDNLTLSSGASFTNAAAESVSMAFASGSANAAFEITYAGGDAVSIADTGIMTVKDIVITG